MKKWLLYGLTFVGTGAVLFAIAVPGLYSS